jgi:hypothetical protein
MALPVVVDFADSAPLTAHNNQEFRTRVRLRSRCFSVRGACAGAALSRALCRVSVMMIEDDVAFWDSWNEEFLEAETDEQDLRLERRLAARLDADLDEMVDDLDLQSSQLENSANHAPPVGEVRTQRPARRRTRRPTLASALKEAVKAGQHVSGAVIEPGKIELRFGEAGTAPSNPWDAEIEKLTKQ